MAAAKQAAPVVGESIVVAPKAKDPFKVKAAYLHQSITWPGMSGTEKSLSGERVKGIAMSLTQYGLMLEKKEQKCLIPFANVANLIIDNG